MAMKRKVLLLILLWVLLAAPAWAQTPTPPPPPDVYHLTTPAGTNATVTMSMTAGDIYVVTAVLLLLIVQLFNLIKDTAFLVSKR